MLNSLILVCAIVSAPNIPIPGPSTVSEGQSFFLRSGTPEATKGLADLGIIYKDRTQRQFTSFFTGIHIHGETTVKHNFQVRVIVIGESDGFQYQPRKDRSADWVEAHKDAKIVLVSPGPYDILSIYWQKVAASDRTFAIILGRNFNHNTRDAITHTHEFADVCEYLHHISNAPVLLGFHVVDFYGNKEHTFMQAFGERISVFDGFAPRGLIDFNAVRKTKGRWSRAYSCAPGKPVVIFDFQSGRGLPERQADAMWKFNMPPTAAQLGTGGRKAYAGFLVEAGGKNVSTDIDTVVKRLDKYTTKEAKKWKWNE